LDEGFPLSGLGPFAKQGVTKAGLRLDEENQRCSNGHRRKGALLPMPAGHA
jgi:hypothetical protein